MEQRKTRTKMYEVIKDGTDFVKGTWIRNEYGSLYAISDKEKMTGAKMVGYKKKFYEWLRLGLLKVMSFRLK